METYPRTAEPRTPKPVSRVHRFALKMTEDQERLGRFLNELPGEVACVVPNASVGPLALSTVDSLLAMEKLPAATA